MLSESRKVVISTGNILNVNRKAGQKTQEEILDCLKLTISDPVIHPKTGKIFRSNDDLMVKVTENERNNIKIGAKVFINQPCPILLQEAIDSLLNVLQVDCLDNLILAYHPSKEIDVIHNHTNGSTPNGKLINGNHAVQNGSINSLSSSFSREGLLAWGGTENAATDLNDLKQLWKILEDYADDKKICQLGVADLDTDTLIELYTTCTIKPIIAQINLSACCVVPPSLQDFCATHEIQLLTHSDPEVVVPANAFNELESDILNSFVPTWTSRYQVHVKCRGVLTAKGFIIGAERG